MKTKSLTTGLLLAFIVPVAFTGCAGNVHQDNVKTHEMGGPKPSYTMRDADMPGRQN